MQKIFPPLILLWLVMIAVLLALTLFEKRFTKGLQNFVFFLSKQTTIRRIVQRVLPASLVSSVFAGLRQGTWGGKFAVCKPYLFRIFVLSFFCWFIFNALAMAMVYAILNIPLIWAHLMFIQFASVVGLLIPAAPSGIGAVHASIISAFYLTNFSEEQGLLFATGFHFLNTVVILLYAIGFVLLQPASLLKNLPSILGKKKRS